MRREIISTWKVYLLHMCIIIIVIIKNKTTSPENKCFTRRSGLRVSEAGSVASWILLFSALIKRKYLLSILNILAIQCINSPCVHPRSSLTPQQITLQLNYLQLTINLNVPDVLKTTVGCTWHLLCTGLEPGWRDWRECYILGEGGDSMCISNC